MNDRPQLDQAEAQMFMITAIAAGKSIPNITVERALLILKAFFDNYNTLEHTPERIADGVYTNIQRSLMACHKDDFVTTQNESPFNDQGKANFVEMLRAYLAGGPESLLATLRRVMAAGTAPVQEPVIASGGNGESIESAVVIHATSVHKGVPAEYWYLHFIYGRFTMHTQWLIGHPNGKYYDKIDITTAAGDDKTIYFDIGAWYPMG